MVKNTKPRLKWGFPSCLKLLTCFGLFMIVGSPATAQALTPDKAQASPAPANQKGAGDGPHDLSEITLSDFVYQRGNRPDPFTPFISEQTVTDQIKTEEEVLTGMRLFEPGQLTLVAITSSGRTPLALVQDSTGKGYILKQGLAIGRKGIVKSIMPNAVLIEESFLNSAGQKRNRAIKMVLRKEGEK